MLSGLVPVIVFFVNDQVTNYKSSILTQKHFLINGNVSLTRKSTQPIKLDWNWF